MGNRRYAILKAHAMLGAPSHATALFWQRYNLRWRHPEQNLADLAAKVVEAESSLDAGAVTKAWDKSLPIEFRGRACVEQLQNGKLSVLVDGKATAYKLSRQYGPVLLKSLNEKLGRGIIRAIVYRVRPAAIKGHD